MQYLLVFLEGIATFVSPCMLPMLPIYVAYFAGGAGGRKTLANALGFVLGFTLVFTLMGATAGTVGQLLVAHKTLLMRIAGAGMILLGAVYTGLLPSPFTRLLRGLQMNPARLARLDFFSSLLFGVAFSVGWTPCIGIFLSSALLMAASAAHGGAGVLMLLCFSLGLGIPFLLAALLLEKLKTLFAWVKAHMRAINLVAGGFLVLVGVAMMGGWLDTLLTSLL